jgi:YidC/Oxa1 family membrane protein insertase
MNRAEKIIAALLFVSLLAWGYFQKTLTPSTPAGQTGAVTTNLVQQAAAATGGVQVATLQTAPASATAATGTVHAATAPAAPERSDVERRAEKTLVLTNGDVEIVVSSWGGGVSEARLLKYRAMIEKDSGPVVVDMHRRPALALQGLPGLSADSEFEMTALPGGTGAVLTATAPGGLQLVRTLTLGTDYRLFIRDTFTAPAATPAALPEYGMQAGTILGTSIDRQSGYSYLGIDTLPDQASQDVTHWGKKHLPGLFGASGGFMSCLKPSTAGLMPPEITHRAGHPVAWAAVKSKFFAQILVPETAASDCDIYAARRVEGAKALEITEVAATLRMPPQALQPGETTVRSASYYVGPKKYSALRQLGLRQAEIMELGWWAWFRWVCVTLLHTLNAIHSVIPNYGVAVIILTILVKVLFWPLTHKSTESAKRMQQIQPLVTELREKYKAQPQKMQQAQMALYKEHGINPMASCLPMLVQLPIFIALFTVLRSAIELRFAGFLWVSDLSEPERLLAGLLPIPLNILPLIMTVTMVIQQKLTPTGGDPQQQKMMLIIMPIMMLFMLYNMASGLMLYWSVSQILSIVQLLHQRKLGSKKEARA